MSVKVEFDEDDLVVDFGGDETPATSIETEFLTGSAGTGKSYEINRRLSENPDYALVCATTGIAAINLGEGVTTVNAALGYFDTESLVDSYVQGWLTKRLRKIAKLGYDNLVIDEVSMMPAEQLDVIVKAMDEVGGMGLIITGDMCQLPPIKARWVFEADCWGRFEGEHETKLTKCWRQADENFLAALAAIRRGDGAEGVELLDKCNVGYYSNNALDFAGTTLVSKNDEVERFNWVCHSKLTTPSMTVRSFRWGKQKGEWKLVPEKLELKVGAYVMILANRRYDYEDEMRRGAFEYVNGDCGEVVSADKASGVLTVKLKRDERLVKVTPITRRNEQKERPDDESERTYFDEVKKRWVIGEVSYVPLRLAYASTVHKCVSADTLIPVINHGLLPIAKIRAGNFTPYGRVRNIAQTEKIAWQITTKRGYTVVASAEHRWLTSNGLAQTQDLITGDLIEMLSARFFPGDNSIESELAWFLGALVGDGNYSNKKEGQLHFSNINETVGNRYQAFIESQGYRCSWRSDRRGLHSTSKPFRARLLALGLDYVTAGDKTIPETVLASGPIAWREFLAGLFDTDGSVSVKRVCLTTISEEMSEQVQLLLLYLGIPSKRTVFKSGYLGRGSLYYQVSVAPAFMATFFREIKISHPDKVQVIKAFSPDNYNRVIKRFDGFDTIERVECLAGDAVTMYDLELESEPHLCAFGPFIGHNSQGLSLDAVQINLTNAFFGSPAMAYVALSRCRTAEGLRIIGDKATLARRIKTDPKVLRFL